MANYEIGRRQFLLTVAGAAVLPRLRVGLRAVLRPGREIRDQRERSRHPEECGRTHAEGACLSSERPWTVSHGPGSARRRVECQGPHGGRADGSRAGGERVAGGRDRHDERAGSAVSRVRAGRELRRALAQVEGRVLERRRVEARDLRKLQRRPCGGAARDASARQTLQRDSASRGAEDRRHRGLCGVPIADQRSVRALQERREA